MSESSPNSIGVLGGTFNPFHLGHLILAQDAIERFSLSQILFVPCSTPPHKKSPGLASCAHRVAMIEAAIEGDLRFSVSEIEIERGGVSYAIDTIRGIKERFRKSNICFVIGSDSLPELYLWKDINELLQLCEFRIFERPGSPVVSITKEQMRLKSPWPEKLLGNVAKGHLVEVSSSEIRHRIAEGLSIRYLVHPAVEMYIQEHRLYCG